MEYHCRRKENKSPNHFLVQNAYESRTNAEIFVQKLEQLNGRSGLYIKANKSTRLRSKRMAALGNTIANLRAYIYQNIDTMEFKFIKIQQKSNRKHQT